ncbi:MAG: ribbon-helix-helix protein, CopG family [bacterium]
MGLYRAQILLETDQHLQLERRAQESGRSMSDLVREIVEEYLTRESVGEAVRRSLAALDELTAMRRDTEREHGLLEASFLDTLMDELREGRDAEINP